MNTLDEINNRKYVQHTYDAPPDQEWKIITVEEFKDLIFRSLSGVEEHSAATRKEYYDMPQNAFASEHCSMKDQIDWNGSVFWLEAGNDTFDVYRLIEQ